MVGHVADLLDAHLALVEPPFTVDAAEPVTVPAGDDRLERTAGVAWNTTNDDRAVASSLSSSTSTITLVVRCRVMSVPPGCTLLVPV